MTITEPISLGCADVWTDKFGLSHLVYKKDIEVTLPDVLDLLEHAKEKANYFNKPFVSLTDIRNIKSMPNEIIEKIAATVNNSKLILAEAVICENEESNRAANYYLSLINKDTQVRIFTNEQKAKEWLLQFLNLDFNITEPASLNCGTLWTTKSGLSYFIVKENHTLTKSDLIDAISHAMERKVLLNRDFVLFFDIRKLYAISQEALELFKSVEATQNLVAVAYVVSNISQRLFANDIMKNTPMVKQEIFNNEEAATKWLNQFI